MTFILMACVLLCPCASALISLAKGTSRIKGVPSLNAFRRIVVLDGGRAKPMDTYARNLLLQFSGNYTFDRKPAVDWLARTLLAPQTVFNDKVLLINNPEIADALGISLERRRRYSFSQIMFKMRKLNELSQSSWSIPAQRRSMFDKEIIRLADNMTLYADLLNALRFTLTIPQCALYDTTATKAGDTLATTSGHLWLEMATTYKAGDQNAFNTAAQRLARVIRASFPGTEKLKNPDIEIFYNSFDLFGASKMLYGIGLLVFALLITLQYRHLYTLISILVGAGLILHTLGIAFRIMIMSRPPITNIYETFVFVGWMVALLGCITELLQRRGWGLALSAAAGFGLLHVAGKFCLEEDTMGMLSAILNSNFWLTTHVITIACGYAGCIAAGLLGHVSLLRGLVSSKQASGDVSIDRCVYGIMAFGFAATVIGTVLGGLWADQSWGRFWGWDPKENGALVIILWCAVLFHMRVDGAIKQRGFAVGSVVGVVLVMFAWIGVNLLGIGMHAYGFTSTGASVLFYIVGAETLFLSSIGAVYGVSRLRTRNRGNSVS